VQLEGNDGEPTNRRKHKREALGSADAPVHAPTYLVPDRLSGLQEVEEFRRVFPERKWNFVRAVA
jgi:hypothetical protein